MISAMTTALAITAVLTLLLSGLGALVAWTLHDGLLARQQPRWFD